MKREPHDAALFISIGWDRAARRSVGYGTPK